MRPPACRILLLVCALLAVVPATAGAATAPKVTSVAPLKLKIGERLTIKGKGFLPGKNRNTVVFKATGARAVFVKAESATATTLVVRLPAKLAPFLRVSAGQLAPTRFRLRVLARKLSASYTPAAASPTIGPAVAASATVPGAKTPAAAAAASPAAATPAVATPAAVVADCDRDGQPDATDPDDDNDLLDDATERAIGTQTCNADSDGDGMEDGWEYQSAIDLNGIACPDTVGGEYPKPCDAAQPYPRNTHYPNPLYADAVKADGVTLSDYDHDGVPTLDEFTAWKRHVGHSLTNMWYSDGLQASVDESATDGCRGMISTDLRFPTTFGVTAAWVLPNAYKQMNDLNGDHCLSDDERDEDGDLLSNFDEISGRMSSAAWWSSQYGEGTYPDAVDGGPITGTTWLDADTDGDKVIDGLDDQDHDDLLNIEELKRGPSVARGDHSGLWVDPFNPCLPWRQSATCDKHPPLNAAWPPFNLTTPADTPWPMYRSWDDGAGHSAPVYHDDVSNWGEAKDNPTPPAHVIPMPGTPYTAA